MNSENSYSTFETIVPVRPDDIDMNQHVHNSKYLDYVLSARFDQMERCYQMPMSEFIDRGFSWFVKTAHISHKRQLHLGDSAIVATKVSKIEGRSCHVEFTIIRQKTGKISAEGWFEYVMVSTETGRAVAYRRILWKPIPCKYVTIFQSWSLDNFALGSFLPVECGRVAQG